MFDTNVFDSGRRWHRLFGATSQSEAQKLSLPPFCLQMSKEVTKSKEDKNSNNTNSSSNVLPLFQAAGLEENEKQQ